MNNNIDFTHLDPHARFKWKHHLTDEQRAEVIKAFDRHNEMCELHQCSTDPRFLSEAVDEVYHGRSVWA